MSDGLYENTPSQAEGEREPDEEQPERPGGDPGTGGSEVPRTTPSQAEGERGPDEA
ncbi:hypothetical protein [Streptomyces sp. NPDC050856]|uniref:hypothetical protein n=1 Tax=Streptomyces sp. NPDC050856 TaxID=3154939 RepID=UPI00340A067C